MGSVMQLDKAGGSCLEWNEKQSKHLTAHNHYDTMQKGAISVVLRTCEHYYK